MKKGILGILLSLFLALSLSACSFLLDSSESTGAGTSSSSQFIENSSSSSKDNSSSNEESSSSKDSSSSDSSSSNGDAPTDPEFEEMSIHYLNLGNQYSGDCTLIKVGDTEVLIDAGSKYESATVIVPYIKQYCTDGVLEYVIATHGDADHIYAFVGNSNNGIFDSFFCETIIDFPQTTKTTQVYKKYVSLRDQEVTQGATHYTALECWNNENGAQRSYELGEGITLNILYQEYYEVTTKNENNYSVCVLISQGEDNHFLFTGDLEKEGEASLIKYNDLPECTVYHAGHHGSSTSSTTELLAIIQPDIVVIPCVAGDQYNFPTQQTINTISKYTDKVYVPVMLSGNSYALLNGNIVVTSNVDGVSVNCSNNNTLFKDTAWFKNNRTWN